MNYLPQFKIYLQSHNYSPATIRNYLADIGRYQAYADKQLPGEVIENKSKRSNDFFGAQSSEVHTEGVPARLWREHQEKSVASLQNIFASEILKTYISAISSDPNYHRYLSSLTKFCQFALDQQLITSNPIKKLRRELACTGVLRYAPTLDDLLKRYQTYLTKKNKTPVTIKNYINDIQQYIRYFEN